MDLEKLTNQTHVQSLGFVSYLIGKFYIEYHTKRGVEILPVYLEDLSAKNDFSRLLLSINNYFEMIITDGLHLNTVLHKLISYGDKRVTSSWLAEHGFTTVSRNTNRYHLFIERGDYENEDNNV